MWRRNGLLAFSVAISSLFAGDCFAQVCDAAAVGAVGSSLGTNPLRCYYGFSQILTWSQAETACEGIGGYLAIIDSAQENALARAASPLTDGPWIGFDDIAVEAGTDPFGFVNVHGGPLIYNGFGAGEPSGPLFGEEDCVHFLTGSLLWNDLGCDLPGSYAQGGYICEVELSCDDLDCDDGNPCTQDSCDSGMGCVNDTAPRSTGCKAAGKSLLLLKNNATDDKDKLTWKWLKGAETSLQDLGVPTGTTNYTLCLYAGTASATVTLSAGSNWRGAGSKGYKFQDPSGTPDGAQKALLKSGAAGKAKALVKGKGTNLPDTLVPTLPLPVTAQLVNDTNSCFEAVFDSGDVIKNDATQFKAKTQ